MVGLTSVNVDLENNLESGVTSLHWWDRSKSEFTKGGVILAVGTLTLEDWELDSLLVVNDGRECSLLDGWDGLTTGNDRGEDVTLHGNTEG